MFFLGAGFKYMYYFHPDPWGRFPFSLPSRELTLSPQKWHFESMIFPTSLSVGYVIVPWRVLFFRWLGSPTKQKTFEEKGPLFSAGQQRRRCVDTCGADGHAGGPAVKSGWLEDIRLSYWEGLFFRGELLNFGGDI